MSADDIRAALAAAKAPEQQRILAHHRFTARVSAVFAPLAGVSYEAAQRAVWDELDAETQDLIFPRRA